ncbi:hypothetical protein FB567DRAFT_2344 [Paraphoma chrysanthemicola]|uniref:Transmembrane protein n=1 Tax=Paraphoma chrysanthemicola TaxID=798071 RepID=A0A8K0W427_9PLEO|nr:hypothetical protein FB567DRAFT_2344 [Paraphoma chrysanthemicola]
MHTTILLSFCAVAVLVPILAIQVPCYLQHKRSQHVKPISDTSRSRQTSRVSDSYFPSSASRARPLTDGSDTPTSTFANKVSRRPWDPPFPVSNTPRRREGEWLVLPPNGPKKGLTPPASGHEGEYEDRIDMEDKSDPQGSHEITPIAQCDSRPPNTSPQTAARKGEEKWIMPFIWTTIVVLTSILLVFGVVILMIHCLAWFIVYQTEARLGEARRGLLMGGEMRLCLCGRG